MNISSAQAYSILDILDGAILSKDGSISVAFFLENPEAYSLDEDILNARHTDLFRAFKYMPENSFVHKQDIFLKKAYHADMHIKSESFISKAERRHFNGRPYLDHICVIAFTLTGLDTLEKSYQQNPFKYQTSLVKKDKEKLNVFFDAIEQAAIIINNIPNTSLVKMTDDELKNYVKRFVNGFHDDDGFRDIRFSDRIEIGNHKGSIFAISDEQYLPDDLYISSVDDTLPSANTSLSCAYLEKIGIHLLANHIYNQVIFFDGSEKLKASLEKRVKLFGQHQKFSPKIEYQYNKLKELEKEIIQEGSLLCRSHFNIMLWDENFQVLKEAEKKVKETLAIKNIQYYCPSFDGIRDIFLGSIVGRESRLDKCFFFLSDLATSLTLFTHCSVFKNDKNGVLFNDRLYQVPLRKDIWDERKERINARNALVVASTGGGKSATVLSIVQQLSEQKHKVIVVEFGRSFEQVCKLYPETSTRIDYDGQTPLGINPFFIADYSELTIEKLKTLTAIVLRFWRVKVDENQMVSITKIIKDYYANVQCEHSFPSFYNYIKESYYQIIERQEIPERFFDKNSFLHVCSEFMPGGVYENICKIDGSNEDKIRSKDFILFELTKIKKDPFLVALIMSILFDTIESKILSDRSTKGILIFDEYAETQSMVDNFSGDDIHSTVAFCYQKLRKENGAVMAIIQTPSQLPDNEYTKGIIANTQLLYVLPTTETVYNQIIDSFSIKNSAHINLMKSIKNNFSGKKPYSEIFIRFADAYATVVRLEFSKEKFLAFQTDGEDWQTLHNDFELTQNMETSINKLLKAKYETDYSDKLATSIEHY